MNGLKAIALALIAAGVLALVYGGFSYTKETHRATLGPLELTTSDRETVNVPMWAGVGAILVGGVMLFAGGKRS
jgi:TRAP-type C4-dicarboxylate transport system permease small subunit